jgi:peptide deformylase
LHANVIRPAKVRLNAFTIDGLEIDQDVTGMMARVIQHETDHLDGVLFVDRLSDAARLEVEPELEEFALQYRSVRRQLPSDAEIHARLKQLEELYC